MRYIMDQNKGSQINRNKQGQTHVITERGAKFAPGNQVSRGHGRNTIDTDSLLDTLKEAEEAHKKPIMRHIWDVAYKDNKFLAKVIDKFIANKGLDVSQLSSGNQFNIIIQTYSDRNKDKDKTITINSPDNSPDDSTM